MSMNSGGRKVSMSDYPKKASPKYWVDKSKLVSPGNFGKFKNVLNNSKLGGEVKSVRSKKKFDIPDEGEWKQISHVSKTFQKPNNTEGYSSNDDGMVRIV